MRALLIRIGQVALTFALFSLCNALASQFEIENNVSILFPATAIAILACMTFGWWAAIGVVLGTIVTPWGGMSFKTLLMSGLISAVEGIMPWVVFRIRRDISHDLRDMRSLAVFFVFGCVLNTGFSALAGNLLIISHPAGTYLVWREVFVWWIADFTAALLVAMPALAFGHALFSRIGGTTHRELAERPRTIANAIQILAVIVLLGFAMSFVIRMSLLNVLEGERLEQQRTWAKATVLVNRIHDNFLGIAAMDESDPRRTAMLDAARHLNDAEFNALEPALAHTSPELSRAVPEIRALTQKWFAGHGPNAAQVSARILALRGDVEAADGKSWAEFGRKRARIMFVVGLVDGFVFLILVAASLTLMFNISRPFTQVRESINAMGEGEPVDPEKIESGYLEFRSLAGALAETQAELHRREGALRLQTERALAASRHKSDFLAKMSHELRTPLNSIIGFSDLLAEQEETIDHVKRINFLENVATSARHLLHLINDLLDVSKIESGKMKMHFENVDLRRSINNTVRSTSPLFVRKRQQVVVSIPEEPMIVRADPSRVEQILLNLLSNANKYSGEGKPVSVISEKLDGRWRIEVRDRGIGISEEDQARIFEDFEQVYTRGPNSSGTGLGLALVKRFAEMQGGEVEVRSKVGEGSTFAITLPAVEQAADSRQQAAGFRY